MMARRVKGEPSPRSLVVTFSIGAQSAFRDTPAWLRFLQDL